MEMDSRTHNLLGNLPSARRRCYPGNVRPSYHVPGLKTWSGKQLFLGVYVRLKREERSGELELSTGCHARARSCDADVTTPVLLQHRARALSKRTGKVYVTRLDHPQGPKSVPAILKIALARPWVLLFKEPIVLIMSTYMAIFYGTM